MEFNIGDRVRFKDLDVITRLREKEQIRFGWNDRMNPLCGMEFTIRGFQGERILFYEDAKELHDSRHERDTWSISASMLEHIPENTGDLEEIAADDQFFDMLMS